MAVYTKPQVISIVRRAFGSDIAQSIAGRLPERLDLDDAADAALLFQLGVTRDRLFDALGGQS